MLFPGAPNRKASAVGKVQPSSRRRRAIRWSQATDDFAARGGTLRENRLANHRRGRDAGAYLLIPALFWGLVAGRFVELVKGVLLLPEALAGFQVFDRRSKFGAHVSKAAENAGARNQNRVECAQRLGDEPCLPRAACRTSSSTLLNKMAAPF